MKNYMLWYKYATWGLGEGDGSGSGDLPARGIGAPSKDRGSGEIGNHDGDVNVPQARRRGEDQYGNAAGHKYPGRGDDAPEGCGEPSWENPVNPDAFGMWDPDIYSEEVYDWIVDPRDPEGDYEDTFNMNDVSTDRGLAYANHRRTIMNKTAITKNTANEVDDEATAIRKDLGITLNGSGMPYICFRDGSFLEIRAKVQDARSREQGIEQDAKYIVVWAYPSLGFENQVGLAGYKNIKYAENMLANCAKVHLAHGLTYTY